jgi:glycosyl transferase family 25
MIRGYCINLDHRKDRWQQFEANCAAQGVPSGVIRRWPATLDTTFGALGCAKSHIHALTDFCVSGTEDVCLILEDDFEFLRPWSDVMETLESARTARLQWDAMLLTGTFVVSVSTRMKGLRRAFESRSTAGYVVTRSYAVRLLQVFLESMREMERHKGDRKQRDFIARRTAIDVSWSSLQRQDRWFMVSPIAGKQREGFSDIEQRHVNYDRFSGLRPRRAAPGSVTPPETS